MGSKDRALSEKELMDILKFSLFYYSLSILLSTYFWALCSTMLTTDPGIPTAVLKENGADLPVRKGEMLNKLFLSVICRSQEMVETQISLTKIVPGSQVEGNCVVSSWNTDRAKILCKKKETKRLCNGLFSSLQQISPDCCKMRGVLVLTASSLTHKDKTDSHFSGKITSFSIR